LQVVNAYLHKIPGILLQRLPGHLPFAGKVAGRIRFYNVAVFIDRGSVEVHLPKTNLRGKQFHYHRFAALVHYLRLALTAVNALAVRDQAHHQALGIHYALECWRLWLPCRFIYFPKLRKFAKLIVIKEGAAQIAVLCPLHYRGKGHVDPGDVVLYIESNFVGPVILGHRVYHQQPEHKVAVREYSFALGV